MGTVIAGEGGSVLVAAALAPEPPLALVCEGLALPARAPGGAPALPLERLEDVPGGATALQLVGGEPATRAALRAWASARGMAVQEATLPELPPPEGTSVVSVSAPATGSGKSAVTRRVARSLRRSGVRVAVARHPLPNLLLWGGAWEARVFRSLEELQGTAAPLELREELEPVVGSGVPVAVGLDPGAVLRAAAGEADVVVWEGGGGARPWVRPDLRVVVVDLMRELPEGAEDQVRAADAVVLAKADSAPEGRAREVEARVRASNPGAALTLADMPPAVPEGQRLQDRAVVVVEDWPSLVLGGLRAGGGTVAARRFRTGVVDPRPFAVGAVRECLERHPHIGPVIPSLGRTPAELADLGASVRATPGEVVLWASPASPQGVVDDPRPVIRVYPELMEVAGVPLVRVLQPLLPGGVGGAERGRGR